VQNYNFFGKWPRNLSILFDLHGRMYGDVKKNDSKLFMLPGGCAVK